MKRYLVVVAAAGILGAGGALAWPGESIVPAGTAPTPSFLVASHVDATPSVSDGAVLGDADGKRIDPAVPVAPPVTPATTATPALMPTATPAPTLQPVAHPTPFPTPIAPRCGGCGPWTGSGPHPLIMCPMYCLNSAQ